MHICSTVVLSQLDAAFEPTCPQKDFFFMHLLLLPAKMHCSPWTLKTGDLLFGD